MSKSRVKQFDKIPLGYRSRFVEAIDAIEADENGCINWPGLQRHGYPYLGPVGAHRIAWSVHHHQPIPAGIEIDHTCCNTLCVNGTHLDAVTKAENVRRAHQRRVQRFRDQHVVQ